MATGSKLGLLVSPTKVTGREERCTGTASSSSQRMRALLENLDSGYLGVSVSESGRMETILKVNTSKGISKAQDFSSASNKDGSMMANGKTAK